MLHTNRITSILYLCASLLTSSYALSINSETSERTQKMNNNRPQTPKPPFPYAQEEVLFENKAAHVTLSGTLTLPEGKAPFPAVILIAGMGPNDRDCSMFNHKLFLVIADHLTRQGIAVLRYDKRGVGKSTGVYSTSLTSQDFANDVQIATDYLKTRTDIIHNKIGLLGESEGAIIAPMIAAQSNNVAFLVLLAGAAITNVESIADHITLQIRADGASSEMITEDSKIWKQLLNIVITEPNFDNAAQQMHKAIEDYWQLLPENLRQQTKKLPFAINMAKADGFVAMFNSPWYRYFLNYNPAATLRKVTAPVLALNGDTDFITSSKKSLPIIDQALKEAGNNDYTIMELPKMNHWFQECQTGAMSEYGTLEQTISPKVLTIITDWILERTNNS